MKVAEVYASLSTAIRLKVGAIVVKDNRVLSIGYNGMPSGWTNECENIIRTDEANGISKYTTKTKPEVIHAEANAIAKLARATDSGLDSIIYGAGIRKVYYRNSYRETSGIEFLQKCNIEVEQV